MTESQLPERLIIRKLAIAQQSTAGGLTLPGIGRLPLIVVLYILCVILPLGFHLGPLYVTTLRFLLLVMILPLSVQLFMGRFGRIIATDILFFLHLLWMAFALFLNNPSQMTTQIGSVGTEFLGGYLIGRAYIRRREDFVLLCQWLILIVLCLTPFAIFESLTGRPLIIELLQKIPFVETVSKVRPDPRMGLYRAQVSFAHAIHYGLFCSVAFSLCFVALKNVICFRRRLVLSVVIMLSGFLALSSGALLALVLQIALILWGAIFDRLAWRWWLLIGIFALAYVLIDILSNRSPIRVFMSYATFSAHNAYWRGIIFEWGIKNIIGDMSLNIPSAFWFGIGINDWVRPVFMRSGSMDNFWLVTGVRYGVPGFLLLILGYAIVTCQIIWRSIEADENLIHIRRAWVFTIIGLTFMLCTVHVWSNIYSFVFFMFGAGSWLITAETRIENELIKPQNYLDKEISHRTATPRKALATRSPHTRFPFKKST